MDLIKRQKQFNQWQKIRDKGKKHFLYRHGLVTGFLLTIIFWLIFRFIDHGTLFKLYFTDGWLIELMTLSVCLPIGGMITCELIWRMAEQQFHGYGEIEQTKKKIN